MAKVEENVERLVGPIIKELGYDLYDVEYVKEGKDYFLRLYIENEAGIGLNDCEKVSNSVTEILDKEDPIKEQYFLEVSSTGVEKVLKKDKHLKSNLNSNVQVKLFKAENNQKQYIGILKDFNENVLILENEENILKIDRKNIAQIKTIYNW